MIMADDAVLLFCLPRIDSHSHADSTGQGDTDTTRMLIKATLVDAVRTRQLIDRTQKMQKERTAVSMMAGLTGCVISSPCWRISM